MLATLALLFSTVGHAVTHEIIESSTDSIECQLCVNDSSSVEVAVEAEPISLAQAAPFLVRCTEPLTQSFSAFSARAPPTF